MNGHHLILGELSDFLTGETLADTHDERYRQKIARILVEQKGYTRQQITPRCDLLVQAGLKRAVVKVDFKVELSRKPYMLLKYGPGSIVTRRRAALAASRLLGPVQIPVVVVTNGEDAEILWGATGKVMTTGLAAIPARKQLLQMVSAADFTPIASERVVREAQILYAFEVDDSCPCDDTIGRIQ